MDILITGFGPFPHVRVNPTTVLAHDVARRLVRAGLDARASIVETSYGAGLPMLREHLRQTKPKAVLMLGLAARARFVRVEVFARGRSSPLHADAAGRIPRSTSGRRPNLPLRTTASAAAALAALRQGGIRARLSAGAGRYLCDACYAAALRTAGRAGVPVLFVHVPWPRPGAGVRPAIRIAPFRPGTAALGAALAKIGRDLTRRVRAGDRRVRVDDAQP